MLFQTKNAVPDIYTESSRDFQLFESIFDSILNNNLINQYKLNYIDDIELVDAKLLDLIKNYLGFFTNQYYPEDLLRSILINFPLIIKNKGSILGVSTAVKALQNIFTNISYITISKNSNNNYTIRTDGVVINQNYISEVLSYVLPIGVIIEQLYIEQDINNLDPEQLKNEDVLINLFIKKDSSNGDYYISSIRKSKDIVGYKDDNSYTPDDSFSTTQMMKFNIGKVGQTPIIKQAIIVKANRKEG